MTLTIERNLLLKNKTDRPVPMDYFYRKNKYKIPVVIFCHGFKGFKDWGHFNYVAEHFANQGMAFVKFNFSHNGSTPPDFKETPDIEAFGNNNFSQELEDLGLVIDWIEENSKAHNWDSQKIYLMGHSRGGGIVLLKTAHDKRIKKCVSWAAVNAFDRDLTDEVISHWKKEGATYVENARTHQRLPLYYQLYEDFMVNEDRLNIMKNVKNIDVPTLIIHGTADEVVPHSEAELLHGNIQGSELLLLENELHSFGAGHPFDENMVPDGVTEVLRSSIAFFN